MRRRTGEPCRPRGLVPMPLSEVAVLQSSACLAGKQQRSGAPLATAVARWARNRRVAVHPLLQFGCQFSRDRPPPPLPAFRVGLDLILGLVVHLLHEDALASGVNTGAVYTGDF